jgi:hypothetical protein
MKIMQTRITASRILQPFPAISKLFHDTPHGAHIPPAGVESIIAASGKPFAQLLTFPSAIPLAGTPAALCRAGELCWT